MNSLIVNNSGIIMSDKYVKENVIEKVTAKWVKIFS
jgi:hypothetical protein